MIDEKADGFTKMVFDFLRNDYSHFDAGDNSPIIISRESFEYEPQGYKGVRILIRKDLLEKND